MASTRSATLRSISSPISRPSVSFTSRSEWMRTVNMTSRGSSTSCWVSRSSR